MRQDWAHWALVAWLCAIFLMGGGSREDILSLVVLRPLAVMMTLIGLYRLSGADVASHRRLLAFAGAIFLLPLLHLIPLPPALWQSLPQRELISGIDQAVGLGDRWRPISIAPPRTWNAWFSLFVPLSVILFLVKLDEGQRARLVVPILVVGFVSALLGVLQVAGGGSSPFYFYVVHTPDAPIGLFANRNHQAVLLAAMFPLLAVFASQQAATAGRRRVRLVVAAAAGVVLIPLLLINGSRAGLVLGLAGIVAAPFILRLPRNDRPVQPKMALRSLIVGGLVLAALVLTTILFARAEALERLWSADRAEEYRLHAIGPVADLVGDYMPLGSGMGTFVEAFFREEPAAMLAPVYLNHAHFDYLELAITGGLPALLLLAAAIYAAIRAGWPLLFARHRDEPAVVLGRAALAIAAMLAAASVFDYPLRTPSLMALMAIIVGWLAMPAPRPDG